MAWRSIDDMPDYIKEDRKLILIREKCGRVQVARWCAPGYNELDWWVQLTQIGSFDSFPTTDVVEWMLIPE